MSLEFQPAPAWLLQEYANRKRPGEILNESLGTAISGYAKAKQDQKTQELAQEDRDIKMAMLASDGGTNAVDALAKIRAERNAPSTPLGQSPSIIDRFKSWMGTAPVGKSPDQVDPNQMPPTPSTGTASGFDPYANVQGMTPPTPEGKPAAPDIGSDPAIQEFNQIGSRAYLEKYGKNGLAKVKMALDIQKGLQDKNKGPRKTYTRAEISKKGVYDENTDYIVDPLDANRGETRQERLAGSFRKELTGSKAYDKFTTLKASAENISNAVDNPGAYGDLSLLFDSMKTLDPGSVVMIGEQERFAATGSFPARVANALNKFANGETLTPEQRNEIRSYAKARLKTAHGIYKSHAEPTLKQVKRLGIDPLEVDPYLEYKVDESSGPVAGRGGLTPDEQAELDALEKRFGGKKP